MKKEVSSVKKRKLRAAAVFEFPPSVMAGGVNISVYGNAGCSIDNFGEILTYSDQMIRLNTELGILKICGEELVIQEIDEDTMILTGRICEVGYENYKRL